MVIAKPTNALGESRPHMSGVGVHFEYALRLRRLGYVCVPLRPNGKHLDLAAMGYEPLHLQTMRKNLKEVLFTGIALSLSLKHPGHDEIAQWFAGCQGNIGIVAGHENLVVLDFDRAADFDRWRRSREALASSTPVARTPHGFHLYLKVMQPTVTSSLYAGMRRIGHVKGLSGYVVISPSRLRDGSTYAWLPGQSPFECSPVEVPDLAALSLRGESPLKHWYDRLRRRGYFESQ
jgi:hypothetical protein